MRPRHMIKANIQWQQWLTCPLKLLTWKSWVKFLFPYLQHGYHYFSMQVMLWFLSFYILFYTTGSFHCTKLVWKLKAIQNLFSGTLLLYVRCICMCFIFYVLKNIWICWILEPLILLIKKENVLIMKMGIILLSLLLLYF